VKKLINLKVILGFVFLFLFIILILLLNVDKDYITPTGKVGLSSFNDMVDYKYNKGWQILADVFLYLGIALVAILAIYGLYELIKRKSLFKVNKYIIAIGAFFIISIILWLLFDKVVTINYRPILVDGEKESSFPSTHTFVCVFIYMSAYTVVKKFLNNKIYNDIVLSIAIVIVIFTAVSRILSGMHYLTDVMGGVFLGLSLYFICDGIITIIDKKEVKEEI